MDFMFFMYGINFVIAAVALCSYVAFTKIINSVLTELPRSLRLYIMVTTFPFAFMVALGSFTVSIFYFIEYTEKTEIFINARLVMAFAAQKLRNSFFLVACERVVATIYLEKYTPYCSKLITFFVLMIISYLITAMFMVPALSFLISPKYWVFYEYMIYFVVTMHFTTIIVCKILHLKNKKMYKLLAYRVTLERRCQVLTNLRVINNIWHSMVIFAIIAPIGSVVNSTVYALNLNDTLRPFCNVHMSYNLAFLFIVIQCFYKLSHPQQLLPMTRNTVITPLGIILPANISIDRYFGDLQKQWG